MTAASEPELLVLHAIRILGFADTDDVIIRFGIPRPTAERVLRQARDHGWIEFASFAGLSGWSLTAEGRAANERTLAAELDRAGARDTVENAYATFLPLNARLLRACTDWQLRPVAGTRLTVNDHADGEWDRRVLAELEDLSTQLDVLMKPLCSVLARWDGYDRRFADALRHARAGDPTAVDRTNRDSCHRVWFQLHEDLIATLGIDRGADVPGP